MGVARTRVRNSDMGQECPKGWINLLGHKVYPTIMTERMGPRLTKIESLTQNHIVNQCGAESEVGNFCTWLRISHLLKLLCQSSPLNFQGTLIRHNELT